MGILLIIVEFFLIKNNCYIDLDPMGEVIDEKSLESSPEIIHSKKIKENEKNAIKNSIHSSSIHPMKYKSLKSQIEDFFSRRSCEVWKIKPMFFIIYY